MMPRLDGLEVCRRLRSAGDDLLILVLTARDTVSERVSGPMPVPTTIAQTIRARRAAGPVAGAVAPVGGGLEEDSEAMEFSDLTSIR